MQDIITGLLTLVGVLYALGNTYKYITNINLRSLAGYYINKLLALVDPKQAAINCKFEKICKIYNLDPRDVNVKTEGDYDDMLMKFWYSELINTEPEKDMFSTDGHHFILCPHCEENEHTPTRMSGCNNICGNNICGNNVCGNDTICLNNVNCCAAARMTEPTYISGKNNNNKLGKNKNIDISRLNKKLYDEINKLDNLNNVLK